MTEVRTAHETTSTPLLSTFRFALLLIILGGCAGLISELILLGHTEQAKQWIPLVLLGLAAVQSVALLWRPRAGLVHVFRVTMLAFLVAGVLGTWFHYSGNVEFELERTPDLGGFELIKASLGGAFPSLAPGAMIQLGLIGLLYTFRHPLTQRRRDGER
ncbi:MAG: hypothetical protein ACT4OZ_10685 [Gemmatimonadota bacterium]